MKKYILILMVFCSFFLKNYAQYNELQLLLNQGRQHEGRNQLTLALEIYESLYEKYPREQSVIEAYLRVLLATSHFEKAREVLNQCQGKLDEYFLTRQECVYLIKTSKPRDAERLAMNWLSRNSGMMQHYRDLAAIFESATLWDAAINIYLRGRQVAADENLHSLELSNGYYYIKNVDKFFEEAIKYLRLNAGFLYYYRTRFKEFVLLHSDNIKKLERQIKDNEPEQVYEIFAFTLVEVKNFAKARTIYEKLPLPKMIKFADDLTTDGYLDFALETYQRVLEISNPQEQFTSVDDISFGVEDEGRQMSAAERRRLERERARQREELERQRASDPNGNPTLFAEIQFKIASIYFEKDDIDNCTNMLQQIIDNEVIQRPPYSHRTRVNKDARLMQALVCIQQDKSIPETRGWFEAASGFANNLIEKSEILFQLARYLYLKEAYTEAYNVIETAITGHDVSSNTYKQSNFYRYEIALFQQSDDRDSLLTECIIYFPEDARITEMLFLETFLQKMGSSHTELLQALRYKGLYQDEQAIETLIHLAETTKMDELYLMAYEWGTTSGNYEMVRQIEEIEFSNPVLSDFVFLHTIRQRIPHPSSGDFQSPQQHPSSGDFQSPQQHPSSGDFQSPQQHPSSGDFQSPQQRGSDLRNQITNFLSHNPQNVFSPQLRYILSRMVNS